MLFRDVTYVGISLVHISIVLHTLFGLVVGGRVFTFALALFLFPTHPPLTTTTQATNFSLATPFALWAKGTRDIPHLLQEKELRVDVHFVLSCFAMQFWMQLDVSNSRVRVHTHIYIYTCDIRLYVYIYLTILRLIVACGSWDSMIVYIVHTLLAMVLLVGVRCANPT